MPARRLAPLLAVAVAALVAAAPAAAEEIPDVWVLPADGAPHLASSWPQATFDQMVDFTIYADDESHDFDVEVATSPDLDPADETLLDANVIARYVAPLRLPFDDVFEVRSSVTDQWVSTLGTYYWQAHYFDADEGELYATPVQRLVVKPRPLLDPSVYPSERTPATHATLPSAPAVVTPPPPKAVVAVPPALTATSARWAVRRAIVRRTHHAPQRLRTRCTRVSRYVAACRPSWRDARHRYRATMQVTARMSGPRAGFVSLDRTRA